MPKKYSIILSNKTKHYIKKLKDKRLRILFKKVIFHKIAISPYKGHQKHGDLSGIWVWNLKYQSSQYRIAYYILKNYVIPILMTGSHENFYKKLRNYILNSSKY